MGRGKREGKKEISPCLEGRAVSSGKEEGKIISPSCNKEDMLKKKKKSNTAECAFGSGYEFECMFLSPIQLLLRNKMKPNPLPEKKTVRE